MSKHIYLNTINRKNYLQMLLLVIATTTGVGLLLLLAKQPSTAQTTNRQLQGLPWKTGETWKYSQDIHGSRNNALDFATPDGQPRDVYSVDNGEVIEIFDSCTIVIKRSDGLHHAYHHVQPTVSKGTIVGYQTKIGTTSLCGTSTGHHLHFYMYDQNTVTSQKSFNPIGFKFGEWELVKQRDESESLASGSDPISGYDYPLKKGTTIACAGTTTVSGKNICTTNLLLNSTSGSGTTNPLTFVNGSSSPSISTSAINYTIRANNLSGKKVYVQMWRNSANGNPPKEWNINLTANSNSITFSDIDGAGNTFAGVDYYLVASLNPISSGEAAKQRTSCYSATGGQQLCDKVRR